MKSHCEKTLQFKESIFATMSKLSQQHQAINLSQGFPDFDCPEWLKELAYKGMKDGQNQYAPFPGLEKARVAISDYYQKFYNLGYDPKTQITVTCGATEAIYVAIHSLINPGDEVIIFEPFYDSYLASIQMAGGIPVPVTLKSPEFTFTKDDLQKAFTSKTKLVIFNSPHNPTGRVFSKKEIELLAEFILKFDCYLLSDEVYEFLTFAESKHLPMASLPGMKERTLTVSSMGKTFGVTGWKIGWVASSVALTHTVRMIHQFNTFSVSTPFQVALVEALNQLESYLPQFRREYEEKRDYFFAGLQKANFRPILPQGTYFIMCPTEHLTPKNDIDFCTELIEEKKVAAIPPSPFYLKSQDGKKLIRFCFAKKKETLEAALRQLL